MTPEEKRHYQRLCDHTCELCMADALALERTRSLGPPFEETGKFLMVGERERPVLRMRDSGRLYVGDALSVRTPDGGGGRVWSASSHNKLRATVYCALQLHEAYE